MTGSRATICCSFCALGLALAFAAQPTAVEPEKTPRSPSIFPLSRVWMTALPGAASAWVADALRAYVSLRDGKLVAVSLTDGSIAWTVDRATSIVPAVGDVLLFVAQGDRIVALDTASGAERWERSVGAAVTAPPLWNTGWLVVGAESGDIVAIRARDGLEVWRRRLEGKLSAQPAIAGDRVYLALDDSRLVSLDLLSGDQVWTTALGGRIGSILALHDRLFVGATDNFLYCVALEDGTIKWRWRTGADVIGSPAVDDVRVYFVSLDNMLRALDRSNGVQRWRRDLPLRPSAGVQRIGSTLLVSGLKPEIAAFLAEDGAPAGRLTFTAELGGPPRYIEDVAPGGEARLIVLTTEISGESRLTAFGPARTPPLVPIEDVLPPLLRPGPALVPFDFLPGTVMPGTP